MKFLRRSIPLWLVLAVAATPGLCRAEVDFAHQIVPILRENCIECHGGDKSKGGFSMNDRDMVLNAGVVDLERPGKSWMIELLRSEFDDERMPPPENRKDPLPEEQIRLIERWIGAGLPWEPGFTFGKARYEAPLKPRRPELPDGPAGANPIDLLIDTWLAANEVPRPGPLDDAAFLRRVSLDLIGLPPTSRRTSAKGSSGSCWRGTPTTPTTG